MQAQDSAGDSAYRVVINHEQQFSLLAANCPNPEGWRDAGKTGTKQQCFDYIDTQWTDMRPLSLRNLLAASAQTGAAGDSSWTSGVSRWWNSVVTATMGAPRS